MYHCYKRALPGHCFRGRYGAKLVDGDTYILRLKRDMHLNPVKVTACEGLDTKAKLATLYTHRWSSLAGYTDAAVAEPMVDYRWLGLTCRQTQRGCHAAYRRYIESFISKHDAGLVESMAANCYAIGDEAFVGRSRQPHSERRGDLNSCRFRTGLRLGAIPAERP